MALKSLRDVDQRLVAIVSVSIVTVLLLAAAVIGQFKLLQGGYEMTGVFTDTAGMKEGDDVRVAGVKAGKVTSVRPDFATGRVIMTWKVDPGVDLGPNTRAEVQTATLLGGRYLRLTGPVAKPYMADLSESRRRIPLDRTSVPFTITDALEGATGITRSLDQKAIDKLLDETAKVDLPQREKLGEMLRNFQELAATLNEQTPQITALIANSRKVTDTLAAKDEQLIKIINSSKVLLDTLVRRRNELARAIGSGSRTVQTLSQVISRHEREIDTMMANLHTMTTKLAPDMDAMNATLSLLGPSFMQMSTIRGNGPWIEGMMVGLGPLQPSGPQSVRRNP